MGIIGGRVDGFSAKRKGDEPIKSLNMNILVEDVQKDGRVIQIKYTCKTSYQPDMAELEVRGTIFWEEENDSKAKAVFDEYTKNKKLPGGVTEEVLTAVNYTNSAVGTLMAFGLGITAPINVPRAQVKPKAGGSAQ